MTSHRSFLFDVGKDAIIGGHLDVDRSQFTLARVVVPKNLDVGLDPTRSVPSEWITASTPARIERLTVYADAFTIRFVPASPLPAVGSGEGTVVFSNTTPLAFFSSPDLDEWVLVPKR